MTIGVYKITSPSGKVYIGSTVNIEKRWATYKALRCKTQVALYRSFIKYGVNNHNFKIEIECEIDELHEWEHHYSNYYNSVAKGLNCVIPGFKDVKAIVSIETKERIGKKSKGRIHSIEVRNKISEGNKGKKMPKHWLEKLSQIHKGKKRSQETKEKMRIAQTGKKHSLERIQKNAKARIGLKASEQTKLKMSKSLLGKGGKLMLNLETGIYYDTVTDVANAYLVKRTSLTYQLKSRMPVYKNICYV